MNTLELKIPPPAVALLVAAAMWGISLATLRLELSATVRAILVIAIATVGVSSSVAGVLAFYRAHTTKNPLKPELATALVTNGIYRWTRNPMYLGLCTVLIAWAFFLSSPFVLVGPVVFVLYMNRFQIVPEERALAKLFGAAFTTYQANVRRWI